MTGRGHGPQGHQVPLDGALERVPISLRRPAAVCRGAAAAGPSLGRRRILRRYRILRHHSTGQEGPDREQAKGGDWGEHDDDKLDVGQLSETKLPWNRTGTTGSGMVDSGRTAIYSPAAAAAPAHEHDAPARQESGRASNFFFEFWLWPGHASMTDLSEISHCPVSPWKPARCRTESPINRTKSECLVGHCHKRMRGWHEHPPSEKSSIMDHLHGPRGPRGVAVR